MTEQNYCDGLDCAYCLDPNCPKDAIIVDGVNVRHCQYYRFEKCSRLGTLCSSDANCYYKKWQREIQKNENLIKISDTIQETIINLARRKKELEEKIYNLICDGNCKKEKESYKQALKVIRIFASEECKRECNFDFCEGETEDTTCVIYKIKSKINEALNEKS